ncbi:MAG: FAD-binding oxidoreductase [Candidatus Saccharibacteria bacterium]|jgi:FAD/FMN-containing dehydrogenase|nr:MAG: FAD-binding oxidoreductase [Candidatus Saccharibacteria bacterium]
MSKVASYLQEHILGEVTTNPAILKAMSRDGSVLQVMPEMVIYPRTTNDIRKVARFAWQLAEKGHTLPLTARGNGADETGGAIGKGIIISLPAHMNRIFELDPKQKLVRVQPGVNASALHEALMLQGIGIPALPSSALYSTIGGAVANNASGPLSGKYGSVGDWTHQLEVVLATGDVLQTGRISKKELNKRKGMGTFEGEIYRNLDNLIEDNKQLIDEHLGSEIRDNVGYAAVARVKQKDGSFDLTPLFAGSQGTLGIISEMIMKGEFMSIHTGIAVAAFNDDHAARDALDQLRRLEPAFLEYYEGDLFKMAAAEGRTYSFNKDLEAEPSAVVVVGFDDFNERARHKKLKKIEKVLNAYATVAVADGEDVSELMAVRGVTAFSHVPAAKDASAPAIVDGAFVPNERFEDFSAAVHALAEKMDVALPLQYRALDGIVCARPVLHLNKVGDKQKIFKLLDEYGSLVDHHGGHMIGEDGEGRLKAKFAYKALDPKIIELFESIKGIFDPYGILNPGVKQEAEVRQLVPQLRSDFDIASIADYVPHS